MRRGERNRVRNGRDRAPGGPTRRHGIRGRTSRGSDSVNVAPAPGADETPACRRAPRRSRARCRGRGRVPGCAVPSTRPNCSKISSWSSGAIPSPWSVTSTTTRPSTARARTSTAAPGGENLTALSIRFESTCRSRSRSPRTGGSPGATSQHDAARAARGRRRTASLDELRQLDLGERVAEAVATSIRAVSNTSSTSAASRSASRRRSRRAARRAAPARARRRAAGASAPSR